LRFFKTLTTLALCMIPVVQQGFAGSLNLSTGQNSGGTIYTSGDQPDANWTVDPPGCTDPTCGTPVTAYTVSSNDADWYGGWVADNSSSDWIARNPDITNNGPADYTFYYTFDLADTTGATASGGWTIDDGGSLILNGNTISSTSGSWGALTAFTIPNADFVTGQNTLEIEMTDSDQYLEGVNLTGTLTGDLADPSTTPEPSTSLLLIGGLGFAAILYSRRKSRA
jgi:hypothetical protein